NVEVRDFVDWMRAENAHRAPADRAGFFGLDIYNMQAAIRAVIDYLDKTDSATAAVARERYGCLTPWQRDATSYGRAAITSGYAKCEAAVVAMLGDLLEKKIELESRDSEGFFDATQNARLVASAERYYRVMYYGGAES